MLLSHFLLVVKNLVFTFGVGQVAVSVFYFVDFQVFLLYSYEHVLLKLWPGSFKSCIFIRTTGGAFHCQWCSFLQALHLSLLLPVLTLVQIFPWISKFQKVCQISFTTSTFSTSLWLCWNALFNSCANIKLQFIL